MSDKGRRKRKHGPKPEPAVERVALPPLKVVAGQKFKGDIKRLNLDDKALAKIKEVIDAIAARKTLDAKHCDHALKGKLVGYRDCHIQGDWVLIYVCTDTELRLYRTGSHSQLGI